MSRTRRWFPRALLLALLGLVAPRAALGAPAGVTELSAQAAAIHGGTARFMVLAGIGNICYWTDPADWVSWELEVPAPGDTVVELRYSCQAGSEGSTFEVAVGDKRLAGAIDHDTGTWYDHETMKLGMLSLDAGRCVLSLKPRTKPGQAVMNLAWIRLIPAGRYAADRAEAEREERQGRQVLVVPNFHPASCGWLTDFSTERNYCGYSYLAHLDRVRDDPTYALALSEVNNQMAILAFEPQRIPELKRRLKEGRAELCNAFFLEPTINLSGGEALVKMGVEGLRWQEQVMGQRPRLVWAIDVTGVHEQMAQMVAGLGLDAIVYTRDNPTPKTVHWLQSPDGTRALALSPGHYSDWGTVFAKRKPLNDAELRQLLADARSKARRTPAGLAALVLGGYGDYALPPARPEYPAGFLRQWQAAAPDFPVRFSTPGRYLDAILPAIRAGKAELPVSRSGARMSWTSFWIQNPKVKGWYRRCEHALQAAEGVATLASLRSPYAYPAQSLYHGWLQMLLNMDRNTLWGAAGGMVFEHPRSWDVRDRFQSVDAISRRASEGALRALMGQGKSLGVYNPLNWERRDVLRLKLPAGRSLRGVACQAEADGTVLCRPALPPLGTAALELVATPPAGPKEIPLPAAIETRFYTARLDPQTGELAGLKLKPSGREVLAGPVRLVAESGQDGHTTPGRPQRKRLADSAGFPAEVRVAQGPLATVVDVRTTFYGGKPSRRTIRFYRDSPRIDFETEVADIPNATVVVAEFPLAPAIREARRGIPFGFSHGACGTPDPNLPGFTDGIQPAIRWSHYQFADGGGAAILDRGLPGRELVGQTPVLFLLNAQDSYLGYPCAWLSGKGVQRASYALVAHEGRWQDARIPQMAWELNAPPATVTGVGQARPASLARTSGNVIVEAVRREGSQVELRLAECLGLAGTAEVRIEVPHRNAVLTDLAGRRPKALGKGPAYRFPVRPQQIITARFEAGRPVDTVRPLLKWDPLVPPAKLAALRRKLPGRKGHPPLGSSLPPEAQPMLPADAARSLTLGRPVKVSNVYQGNSAWAGELAVDGDENTRWATDDALSEATLEVDLGRARRISRAYLSEAYDRVRAFVLEYEEGGRWQVFARGSRIGANLEMRFEPVTARRVRLHVTDGPGGPTIWELLLFR